MAHGKTKTKLKTKDRKGRERHRTADDGHTRPLRGVTAQIVGWVIAVAAIAVAGGAAFDAMEERVIAARRPHRVLRYDSRIVNAPAFVPSRVARKVAALSLPHNVAFDDPALCRTTAENVAANALVKSVRRVWKRRSSENRRVGVVTVDAIFRRPFAIVCSDVTGNRKYYVDRDGVRLPGDCVAKYVAFCDQRQKTYVSADGVPPNVKSRRIHYIVIRGVRSGPPRAGERWVADDLAAGLKLVALLRTREYGNQVTVADVRNYNQRVSQCDPELQAYAQIGHGPLTEIRFGRFPRKKDWVVTPDCKMRYLDEYVHSHGGRLAGLDDWLDLRYDELHVSPN